MCVCGLSVLFFYFACSLGYLFIYMFIFFPIACLALKVTDRLCDVGIRVGLYSNRKLLADYVECRLSCFFVCFYILFVVEVFVLYYYSKS